MIVRTTYLKATETQGERIKARDERGHTTIVGFDYALSEFDNHQFAACSLAHSVVHMVKPRQRGYTWSTTPLYDTKES